ncbi:hypothetical protein ABMA28_007233 [Loxostege sticticalis]|uniref:Uncharacterized protein n=1 Tax=Loxostege sticticalis TaxID=481309 RepID=A0ABD0TPZ4_LOXSC
MTVVKLSLLFGLSVLYVECLYIAEDGKFTPMNGQLYNGEDNFGLGRLRRQDIEYTKSARAQPEQTVIVVPNQGTGNAYRQPYGYGNYGSNPNRGPTVIVNVPDEYNNRVITDPYRRY